MLHQSRLQLAMTHITRMHSSRMRTARSSSHRRGSASASVHAGIQPPSGVGLETPPGQTPQLPPWVWAWRPPLPARPLNFPFGCGPGNLQDMLGYHPSAARHAGIPPAMHAGIPSPPLPWTEFLTQATKNITLPQTSIAGGKNLLVSSTFCNRAFPPRNILLKLFINSWFWEPLPPPPPFHSQG